MIRGKWLLAVIAIALATGCGSAGQGKAPTSATAPTAVATPPRSFSYSPKPVATVTIPPEPSFSFEFGLGPGYPKQVPLSDVPDNFRANLPSEATSALLLAPNVYAPLAAGESIGDVIQQSGLVGLCASVQAYVAEHPNQMHGYSCF